ncbi:MAG: sigma-70 family RNA polymerase sigma factor [Reichenbachiella sp.]|uniref:RNA polymerase sigma factor n=1 Tax=Reichenbachiella sp. TaxID=2184521 RepID=UPI00296648FA|nr:sigma-70 family RNA polymerase sigma factor [Reichenbachiella sp.]MDW3209352.1 sigma-70 family RNA polymerase sigma factor [Reichenbachiella sp.]
MDQPSVCEEQSFTRLHQIHGTSLQNFLFYRFGSLEKAKDCAQEAFVRLWNNCSKVAFDKAKSFLFTTANRIFLDDNAHQKVVLKFERRSDTAEAQLETNPEFLYQMDEFKEQLESVVSGLPEKQRVVFLMSRIDKMKNQEIADTLDISVKTVEKHITSSLKSIRADLDELNHFSI